MPPDDGHAAAGVGLDAVRLSEWQYTNGQRNGYLPQAQRPRDRAAVGIEHHDVGRPYGPPRPRRAQTPLVSLSDGRKHLAAEAHAAEITKVERQVVVLDEQNVGRAAILAYQIAPEREVDGLLGIDGLRGEAERQAREHQTGQAGSSGHSPNDRLARNRKKVAKFPRGGTQVFGDRCVQHVVCVVTALTLTPWTAFGQGRADAALAPQGIREAVRAVSFDPPRRSRAAAEPRGTQSVAATTESKLLLGIVSGAMIVGGAAVLAYGSTSSCKGQQGSSTGACDRLALIGAMSFAGGATVLTLWALSR